MNDDELRAQAQQRINRLNELLQGEKCKSFHIGFNQSPSHKDTKEEVKAREFSCDMTRKRKRIS